jgi:hypothetical protein
MTAQNDKNTDKRISLLLSTINHGANEPDKQFLDKLKERSTAEFVAHPADGNQTSEKTIPISRWRIIMKSPITKLAAAALVIAAVIGISRLGDSIGMTSVTWAKVAQLMENIPAHVHRQSRIVTCEGKKIDHMSSDNVLTHFLPGVGYREDMYDRQGQLMMRIYGLLDRKTSITVIPILRQYKIETLSDDQLSAFKVGFPRIVECIKSGDYKELGRKVINGMETEGIEFTNPFLVIHTGYPLRFDELLFRMWVDVQTSLPVYMEVEATSTDKFLTLWTGGKPLHVKAVVDEIQWYADIDPKELEPDIPDDFILISDEADGLDEGKAILGLKAFAEVTQGTYPNSLSMTHILIDGANAIIKRLGDNAWVGGQKDQAEALWRRVICCKSTCLFYDELQRQDKDVAYFGDTVTAKDTDAVLMRWKISDDQYRILFGNLITKDISADQLAEVEGASSKE